MKRTNRTLLIALVTLLAASACVLTLPAAETIPPTASAGISISQRSQTLTASAPTTLPSATRPLPSLTPSVTATEFPSITPLPTATATDTETPFGFVPSETPAPPTAVVSTTPQATDSADGYTTDWGSPYRCTLISKTIQNGTIVIPQLKYKMGWTLYNSGTKRWQADQISVVYLQGAKFSATSPAFFMHDVKVGDSVTPVINIFPPSAPGTYKAVWGLRVNKTLQIFCTFSIAVTVGK